MCPIRGDRTPRPNANAYGEASTQPHDTVPGAEHSGGLPRSVTVVNTEKVRRGDLQRSHKSYSASCIMKESTNRRHGASVCASESLLRTILPSVPRTNIVVLQGERKGGTFTCGKYVASTRHPTGKVSAVEYTCDGQTGRFKSIVRARGHAMTQVGARGDAGRWRGAVAARRRQQSKKENFCSILDIPS